MNLKFKEWDAELETEKSEEANRTEIKVFNLNNILRYAIVTSIIIAVGIIFNNYNKKGEVEFAIIQNTTVSLPVYRQIPMGFSSSSENEEITIIYVDQSNRIASMNDDSENLSTEHKKELKLLQSKEGKYTFNKKQLILYFKNTNTVLKVIKFQEENTYFILLDKTFYTLQYATNPTKLIEVEDSDIKRQLDRIIFNISE